MADSVDMKAEGFEDAIRALDQFTDKVKKRAILRAVRKGGVAFRESAKRAAPRRAGHGVKRIGTRTTRVRGPGYLRRHVMIKKKRGRPGYSVGPPRSAYYSQIVEFGSKHMHAQPWLAPSWRVERLRVVSVLQTELRKAVQAEARKAKK